MDLYAVPLDDPDEASRFATVLAEVYGKLLTLPIPLLCGVDGPVMGGGGGLALAGGSDLGRPQGLLRFSGDTARRGAGARLGGSAPPDLAAHPPGLATTGIPCDASRSVLVGLADFLASDSATIEAEACAQKLLHENSGVAMRRTKNS